MDEQDRVHTSPEEGHPAGESDRSDRDIGGPTTGEESGDATGGGPGTKPDTVGIDSHSDGDDDPEAGEQQ